VTLDLRKGMSDQVLHRWANRFLDEGASEAQVEQGQEVILQVWEYALGQRDWESASRALSEARSEEWFRVAADKEGLWRTLSTLSHNLGLLLTSRPRKIIRAS